MTNAWELTSNEMPDEIDESIRDHIRKVLAVFNGCKNSIIVFGTLQVCIGIIIRNLTMSDDEKRLVIDQLPSVIKRNAGL
jgi:hypothetical protein